MIKKYQTGKLQAMKAYMDSGLKKITSIYDRLAIEINRRLQKTDVPERMTKGRTTLIQKVSQKETAINNYRPITCQPMMWKILTAQIREIYHVLINRGLFPEEQKGYCKGTRRTRELLHRERLTHPQ